MRRGERGANNLYRRRPGCATLIVPIEPAARSVDLRFRTGDVAPVDQDGRRSVAAKLGWCLAVAEIPFAPTHSEAKIPQRTPEVLSCAFQVGAIAIVDKVDDVIQSMPPATRGLR